MTTTSHEIYDVAIVGSGPSGAIAARRLAEEGFSVVCLEQGEYPNYTAINFEEPTFELTRDMVFSWNPNTRMNSADYPINDSESDVSPFMWNGVGGSSVIYAAAWHRFQPSNFRVKTLDGVAEDWPLTYDDLAPYYTRAEAQMSVSGVGGDPSYPPFDPPLPPMPMGVLDKKMFAAHERLGWHIWPGTNAISTVRQNGMNPCVRRGACMAPACFDGAKGSVDRTHWPINIKLGVKLVQRARVARVETDSAGLATGVTYIDRATGATHFQPARIVILSANGIGTPRILLNSDTNRFANGLANSSDMVGRNLMMHPHGMVMGLFDDHFDSWQGPTGQRAYSQQFTETQPGVGFVRGAKWQLMGTGGPLGTIGVWPWGKRAGWGEEFHKAVYKRFGRSGMWSIIGEDLPNPDNRVVIDPDLKDADGIPAPKVIYRCDENSKKLVKWHEEHAAISFKEAGAYETIAAPDSRETGWHILGAARMGNNPETSVVNAFNQAHDVPNLYVIDGSVMPTSGPVNPTGTVAALALRAAEKIAMTRRDQIVSFKVA
ncbi:GMC family oxidoreductase [Rhizobium leguminosarum]|uniref:GMC family oxidoreductase n=1 Tax=Rhizobium leguminosarum TaxID=384 RepID=UPI0024A8DAA9|nr:GMC family oxidoreductase [Rhizobium leguminosarum]MDI5929522.1 GMC family oxidoreductase [Rhizobium leguminosarum]